MMLRSLTTATALIALSACSLAPHYDRPTTPSAPTFKEAPGWQVATPTDDIAKGEWWKLFGDPVLNDLESKVAINNQNVAAYAAAYQQARATVREARASFFPTVTLNGSADHTASFGKSTNTVITGGSSGSGVVTSSSGSSSNRYTVSLGASWEPDLWGQVASTVRADKATAAASLGDLNNATLSAQGELATDYVQLRGYDQQKRILDDTVTAYERALQITTNRYNQGVVARVDMLQAESQLASARASAADLLRQRQAMEHAIAVLIGENPSRFSIQPAAWNPVVPDVPGILPADLLQRRPDIAAAERRAAAANQQIGVQRAAFFPALTLTGDTDSTASKIGQLFSAASSYWSLGASVAETILDFGARKARVAQARAAYNQQIANYRQTVLTAFQQVEDELAASQILGVVAQQRIVAARSANQVEAISRNQYLAGQIAYSDVITQQATALSARQAEATAIVDRQVAAVTLIQAIGGSWVTPNPPKQ